MKNIIAFAALFLFVVASGPCFAAGTALASGNVTTTDGTSIYGGLDSTIAASTTAVLIGKCSKGVYFGANYDETDGLSYAIDTKHVAGTKAFGTAHDATAIYTTEIGVGSNLAAPSASNYTSFSSWTAM